MPGKEPLMVRAAEPLGAAAGALWRALPVLLGWALVSVGAWLAWPPAGFLTAGGLLLADQVADRITTRRRPG
ncbi:hypothetical protein OH768_24910 [Streptomyces sp. NBC_01622]|uniref:hypothetical protein n=1 Tax=Streptomyces sp. NBC_01622 TaxID=2975903 RepID=UPI00386CFC62|nr:hypothetical protein OH768_24910 [Streptomyces sp. NBC_01622]